MKLVKSGKSILRSKKLNKYCLSLCTALHQKQQATVQIESGKVLGIAIMRRYIFETRGHKCESCDIGNEYNNKPLTLQLDHINGNSDDNSLTNLQILCTNCHSQTDTYGSKGKSTKMLG